MFYIGKNTCSHACKCFHILAFAPEIQLYPEPCTAPAPSPSTQSRRSKAPPASQLPATISSTVRGIGSHWNFPRTWLYWHHPNRAHPNDSAAATSDKALKQLKVSLIAAQGKALYLNLDVFGGPVVHSWFSVHSVCCRDPPSVLYLVPVQFFLSTQGTHDPSKGGDKSNQSSWKRKEQLSADKNKYNATLPSCITIGKHF